MNAGENNKPNNFRLLHCDSLRLAVAEDQITTIIDWTEPTPLPFAPRSVLGIVCIEGRMYTVLDLAKLLEVTNQESRKGSIVALSGDEQLALAVDLAEEMIDIDSVSPEPADSTSLFPRRFDYRSEKYNIIVTDELFPSILQGRERRRRRF